MAEPAVPPRVAADLIDILAAEVEHGEVVLLAVTMRAFFDDPQVRERTGTMVAGVRGQLPAAMDSRRGSMVIGSILVVVNGIVAGVLGDGRGEPADPVRRLGWLARRRLARRLGRGRATAGEATELPVLAADHAARVVAEARLVFATAGLTAAQIDALAERLAVVLDQVAGRHAGA